MRTKYPNKLEIVCGILFMGSLLATSVSAAVDVHLDKPSYRTIGLAVFSFASGYGAFRREGEGCVQY
jgi:hypothetical protein